MLSNPQQNRGVRGGCTQAVLRVYSGCRVGDEGRGGAGNGTSEQRKADGLSCGAGDLPPVYPEAN